MILAIVIISYLLIGFANTSWWDPNDIKGSLYHASYGSFFGLVIFSLAWPFVFVWCFSDWRAEIAAEKREHKRALREAKEKELELNLKMLEAELYSEKYEQQKKTPSMVD